MTSRYTHQHLTHRFSPGSKLFFGTVVGWLTCWIVPYASYDIEHAAPGGVLHASRPSNASSRLPGPPAGGRGKDGRIHNDELRHSPAAQREVASLCLYIWHHHFLYISTLCWRARGKQRTSRQAASPPCRATATSSARQALLGGNGDLPCAYLLTRRRAT